MCFSGERDVGPPPRLHDSGAQYDAKFVQYSGAYADEQERRRRKQKRKRNNGVIAALAASSAVAGGGGGGC